MTAPTEAEIRAAILQRATEPSGATHESLTATLRYVISDYGQAISSPAFDAMMSGEDLLAEDADPLDLDGLWADLRRSEAIELKRIVDEATDRALARCEAIIVEEVTAAGLRFAAEYPDAPRPRVRA